MVDDHNVLEDSEVDDENTTGRLFYELFEEKKCLRSVSNSIESSKKRLRSC